MLSIEKKIEETKLKLKELNRTLSILIQKEQEVRGEGLRLEGELRVLTEINKEKGYGINRDTPEDKSPTTG